MWYLISTKTAPSLKHVLFEISLQKDPGEDILKYDVHFWIGSESSQVCISLESKKEKLTGAGIEPTTSRLMYQVLY